MKREYFCVRIDLIVFQNDDICTTSVYYNDSGEADNVGRIPEDWIGG